MFRTYSKDKTNNAYTKWLASTTPSDTCMFAHRKSFEEGKGLSAFNNAELKDQMKIWRKQAKDGVITIRNCNSKTKTTDDGREWFIFVVQAKEALGLDPLGMFVLSEMVDGFIYAFTSKANRDSIQKYIMKGLTEFPCDCCCEEMMSRSCSE